MFGFSPVSLLGFIIIIAFIYIGLYVAVKKRVKNTMDYFKDDNQKNSKQESAFDILNKKYANGEISEDEYLKKKKNIEK